MTAWRVKFYKTLVVCALACHLPRALQSTEPPPGPYYFVSAPVPGPEQFHGRGLTTYGGVRVVENFNLLAAVLGDEPEKLLKPGWKPAPSKAFGFGEGTVYLKPFAYTTAGEAWQKNLPAGSELEKFLADPLNGASFDLTLPFNSARVALSDNSAALRGTAGAAAWHVAADFDVSGKSTQGFDVLAPADGVVHGNTSSVTLCLKHTAANGREFLTLYSHLVPASKEHLKFGGKVRRGEIIGRVQEPDGRYTHLHFTVAVKGPARNLGGTRVPELWYIIDPFGVYDYRRDRFSATSYNYLPDNTLAKPVRGIHKAYVWRTNPPIGSLPGRSGEK